VQCDTQSNVAEPAHAWDGPNEIMSRRASLAARTDPPSGNFPSPNMSGYPEKEYFSDGISEDIITALAKLRCSCDRANSSCIYKGKTVHRSSSPRSRESAIVVEGTCARLGSRRITAQLNE